MSSRSILTKSQIIHDHSAFQPFGGPQISSALSSGCQDSFDSKSKEGCPTQANRLLEPPEAAVRQVPSSSTACTAAPALLRGLQPTRSGLRPKNHEQKRQKERERERERERAREREREREREQTLAEPFSLRCPASPFASSPEVTPAVKSSTTSQDALESG